MRHRPRASKVRGARSNTVVMEAHDEHYHGDHSEEYVPGDHTHGEHEICANVEPVKVIKCKNVGRNNERCVLVGKKCQVEHSMKNGKMFSWHTKCQ